MDEHKIKHDEHSETTKYPQEVPERRVREQLPEKPSSQAHKPVAPKEPDGYKVVVTIVEHYKEKEQAEESYNRFSGGGDNHAVLKQGDKTISEKGWGDRTDAYGHHAIDGRLHKIIYTNE
jgi:hypothetical protein